MHKKVKVVLRVLPTPESPPERRHFSIPLLGGARGGGLFILLREALDIQFLF